MSDDPSTYICSICKSSADLYCSCSKIFICTTCIGSHLIKNFAVKHRPILISDYLSSTPLTDLNKPNLNSAIQSKLSNELLELEEFRKISLQKISEFLQLAEKQLLDTVEKVMNEVSDEVENVQREIRAALGCLKLPESYPNKIISFFDNCKSADEVRELTIVHKGLDLKYLNIENVIKECICFYMQMFSAPEIKEIDSEVQERSNSGLARFHTLSLDHDGELSSSTSRLVKFNSIKAINNMTQRSITPQKNIKKGPNIEIELINNIPSNTEEVHLEKKIVTKKSLLMPVLAYFYPNSNKFALFNVNTLAIQTIDVPNHFFLAKSAWSMSEGGRIIQTGGFDTAPRGDTFIYNLITNATEKAVHLNIKRYNHSQISLADHVYIIGGTNKSTLKSVERLNLIDFKWKKIGKMNIARSNPACCSHNNKLYIIGGEETKSVEQFNTISKKFTLLSLMLPNIGKWGVFSYDQRIFLLRGCAVYQWDGVDSSIKRAGEVENREWVIQGESYNTENGIFFMSQQILYKYDLSIEKIIVIKDLSNYYQFE